MSKPILVSSISGYLDSTHTTIPAIDGTGADYLIVRLCEPVAEAVVAPTVNGVALTTIIAGSTRVAAFGLTSPPQSSFTISATPGVNGSVFIIELWKNVDQTTPFGSPVEVYDSSTYPNSLSITSVTSNDIVTAHYYYTTNGYTPTWVQAVTNINSYFNVSGSGLSAVGYLDSVYLDQSGNPVAIGVSAGYTGRHWLQGFRLNGTTASGPANGISSLTLEDKTGTLMTAGTSVSVTVDTTTGTNVFATAAQTITSANQIPVIDLSSAVTAGTIANGDTVNYRVDYGGETTIVPQTVVASPT